MLALTEEALDPFALAHFVKIQVIEPAQIPSLASDVLDELTRRCGSNWSAATVPLPDRWQLCILNPTHSPERTRATLMEEIAHVVLGHRPTRIMTGPDGIICRDYNVANERAAYAVGAAALLPFAPLFLGLMDGQDPQRIANRYGVSPKLVEYKITMLWPVYKSRFLGG